MRAVAISYSSGKSKYQHIAAIKDTTGYIWM